MTKRGRESGAALEIVRLSPQLEQVSRLHSPPHLTSEERAVWLEIVKSAPRLQNLSTLKAGPARQRGGGNVAEQWAKFIEQVQVKKTPQKK